MIQLQDVSLRLDGRILFDKLSVEVASGGRLMILGASGTGKTTLLRMLLGFVLPDSGCIRIAGEELSLENVWRLRRQMAYVSQEMQIGRGGVEAFIREIFNYRSNRDKPYPREKALELLDDFELNQQSLGKRLEDLSGGELQRLAIIVTLLLDRPVYLLDEVTSALDQPLKEMIVSYFSGLKDKTLIVSSHDSIWHRQGFQTLDLNKHGSRS